MKWGILHKGVIASIVIMLIYITGCGSSGPGDSPKFIKIGGYVKSTTTDGTVVGKEGVIVTAQRMDVKPSEAASLGKTTQLSDGVFQAITDSNGYFELELPPADYMVVAEGPNNEKASQKVAALEADGTLITVDDFILTATGSIKGQVVKNGIPLGDHDLNDEIVYIPGTSYLAVLDKDGTFILSDVPVGIYTLNIGEGSTVENVTVEAGQTTDIGIKDIAVLAGADSARQMVETAKEYMEEHQLKEALDTFRAAYEADPTNKDAILGVAMLELVFLIEDPSVVDIITRWGGIAPVVQDIYGNAGAGAEGGSTVAPKMQMVLSKVISPVINVDTEEAEGKSSAKMAFKRTEDPADLISQTRDLIKKLPRNEVSLTTRLSRILNKPVITDFPDAPSVSEMQTLIENNILPVIDDAMSKLRLIEGKGFTFIVTPAMRAEYFGDYIVLDDGDFYALDAMLSGLKSAMLILVSYNLDFDYAYDVEADPLSVINGPYEDGPTDLSGAFFTLKDDGLDKMARAGVALRESIVKLLAAHDYIIAEDLDADTDGGINLSIILSDEGCDGEYYYWEDYQRCIDRMNNEQRDHHDMMYWLKKTANALKGPVDIYDSGPDDLFGTPDDQYLGRADLSKFFSNPLDRSDLLVPAYDLPLDMGDSEFYGKPVHTVLEGPIVVESKIVFQSDLEDKTLNGIFPDGIPFLDAFVPFSATFLIGDQIADRNYRGMTSDGTSLWLAGETVGSNITIYKIDPSTGDSIMSILSPAGGIRDIGYTGGALWALDGRLQKINPSDGTITTVLNLSSWCWPSGITGDEDGVNLWIGDSCGNIYKVDPAEYKDTDTVPLSPLGFNVDEDIWSMTYGGGYLWVNGDKIDPSTGDVLGKYGWPTCIDNMAYQGGSLYSACDYRINKFTAP